MTFIFPRITKCTYYDFGSSGDVQKHDALCLLPLNIINEKIYIALWFWFLVLALLTLLVIIYRLLAISSEQVRCKGLLSRCKLSNELDIRIICRHCDVGDWFLFYMVAENLDPLIMREIVNDIANKIRAHFELKRELSMLHGDSEADRDSMYKFRPPAVDFRWRYRGTNSQSFDESRASTRRSSLADEVPLVRKLKKRLHPKRLWSVDMGTSGLQPFSQQQQQQQPTPPTPSTPPSSELPRPTAPIMRGQSITSSGTVSVGALSPGELESAPPPPPPPPPPQAQSSQQAQHHDQQRRAELTRAASTTSSTASTATVESYVMEMQPMSRPSAELCASRLERRPSSHGQRPPLLRQRNSQSIASIRDLRLNHSPATAAAAAAAGLEP